MSILRLLNKTRDQITRKDVIDSLTEVSQLVVEDDSGAERDDLGAKPVNINLN